MRFLEFSKFLLLSSSNQFNKSVNSNCERSFIHYMKNVHSIAISIQNNQIFTRTERILTMNQYILM